MVFKSASDLKRAYEFLANPKTKFEKLIEPYSQQTVQEISGLPVVLAVGDTTYLDYKKIVSKREDYGPTGNGGNGLILHTARRVDPDFGQPLGLLWEKLWHREKPTQPQEGETLQQKKQRLKQSRQLKRKRPIEQKESYRWVEAFQQVDSHFREKETALGGQPKVIHVFDREGDISEVFEQTCQIKNTGVVVRAAHNRATGKVAPSGCWIVRYQARGRKGAYWYYKLQATVAIFPSKNNPQKLSKYKHLGKAGSLAYLDTVEQVARRAKIEGLQQAIDTLKLGLSDLSEEASKYK